MAAEHDIQIYIDGTAVAARRGRLTGAELRALVEPHAENVWLDVPDAQDEPVSPDSVVAIAPGMRFFTDRPRTIFIDKVPYEVRAAVLTVTALRALPIPPVPSDFGIWRDIPDELDEPIKRGQLVAVAAGDRFFTKRLPKRDVHLTVNRRPVIVDGRHQTGATIKQAAIAQGVLIQPDFLLSRKVDAKFSPVRDDEQIEVHDGDEFRANDGDDNS